MNVVITVTAPMSEAVVTRHRTATGAARRLSAIQKAAADVHAAWGRGVYDVTVEVDGRRIPNADLATCDGDYAAVLRAA